MVVEKVSACGSPCLKLFYSKSTLSRPATATARPLPSATVLAAAAPVEFVGGADPDLDALGDPEALPVPETCVTLAVVLLAPLPVVAAEALLTLPVAVTPALPDSFSTPAVTVTGRLPIWLAS